MAAAVPGAAGRGGACRGDCGSSTAPRREEPFHFEVLCHTLFFSGLLVHLQLFSAAHCMVGQPFAVTGATCTSLDELGCLYIRLQAF